MVAIRPFGSGKGSKSWITRLLAITGALMSMQAHAIELDLGSPASIKKAALTTLKGMLSYYHGNEPGQIPGLLPPPYYWWEVGAMFGAMIDYWFYTKDDQFNDLIMQGMLHQIGDDGRIMPINQTNTEGNDDQAFWAIATMQAAERNFPNPPEGKPQWLATTQTVFNLQATRWDDAHCNGGLRWQIFQWNNGYTYKNTVSNGCFFQLAARLARYTGNTTYSDWANKVWDWSSKSGIMTNDFKVYDGLDMNQNCAINHNQWSYNTALYLSGAAYMYNITTGPAQDEWKRRIDGLYYMSGIFFNPKVKNVMYEAICEPYARGCNTDQKSFKAYLSRWYGLTAQMAPYKAPEIMDRLRTSAAAAAASCVGESGTTCGMKWYEGAKWDGSAGVGEQMSAMEVIQTNLITGMPAPYTATNGGTSEGNPSAGGEGDGAKSDPIAASRKATPGEKAAASFATLFVFSLLGFMAYYMVV